MAEPAPAPGPSEKSVGEIIQRTVTTVTVAETYRYLGFVINAAGSSLQFSRVDHRAGWQKLLFPGGTFVYFDSVQMIDRWPGGPWKVGPQTRVARYQLLVRAEGPPLRGYDFFHPTEKYLPELSHVRRIARENLESRTNDLTPHHAHLGTESARCSQAR
jgi:hypothetical protein